MATNPKTSMWGVLGIVVVALSLIGGTTAACVWLFKAGKDAGANEVRLAFKQAENAALLESQRRVAELEAELQDVEELINEESKNDTAPVPPSIGLQLDRMHRNQTVRDGKSR